MVASSHKCRRHLGFEDECVRRRAGQTQDAADFGSSHIGPRQIDALSRATYRRDRKDSRDEWGTQAAPHSFMHSLCLPQQAVFVNTHQFIQLSPRLIVELGLAVEHEEFPNFFLLGVIQRYCTEGANA